MVKDLPKKKTRRGRRERRWSIVGGGLGIIILSVLTIKAILQLSKGNYIGWFNYYGQIVNPVVVLLFVGIMIIIGAVLGWRHWRGEKSAKIEKKKSKKEKPAYWLQQPPYRWPWE